MQKSLFIITLLGFMLFTSPVFTQSGQALLKIVVDEDGTSQVFNLRDQNSASQTSSQENETVTASQKTNNPPVTPRSAPNDDPMQPEGTTACGHNLTWDANHTSMSYNSPTLTVNVRIINNGESCAMWPIYDTVLGYYLSTDAQITTSDFRFGTDAVPALNFKESSTESITYQLTQAGTWYIGFIIDYTEQQRENDENDNASAFSNPISYDPKPNLSYSKSHSNFNFNDPNLTINVRVINTNSAESGSSRLGFYLSTDRNLTKSDYRIGDNVVGSLTAGHPSDETITVGLTTVGSFPPLPTGTHSYYVGFIVDCRDEVDELDENDNNGLFNQLITFTKPGVGPNLVINPDTAVSKISFNYPFLTIQTRVLNTGAVASDTCRLTYYVFKDTLNKANGTKIGSTLVDSLSPGAFQNLPRATFNLIESGFIKGDIVQVGAMIDDLEQVTESNENDNLFIWPDRIVITEPSAWLTNFRLTPASPAYLHHEEWVYVGYNYTHEGSGYINVHIKPFSYENEQLDAVVSEASIANAHYPGTGIGTVYFRIRSGTEQIDYIRLRICPYGHPETFIWQTFIPVEYHYSGNKIHSIQFSPPSPDNLFHHEAVNTTFDYCTNEVGGVRIYANPYTNGMPTPGQYFYGVTYFPEGTGSGSLFFGVHSGVVTVDQVRFFMKSRVTNQLIYEKFVPVQYNFRGVKIYWIHLDPASPAELANNECVEISFRYYSGMGTDIIHAIPFSEGNETPHAKICEYGNRFNDVLPSLGNEYLGWVKFTIESDDVTVDQVKLQVKRADGQLVGEVMLPVEYHFGSSSLEKAPTDATTLDEIAIPTEYRLCQNHPNPFNPFTTIAYDLPGLSTVKLTIFNLQGQIVHTQEPGIQPAGRYSLQWNGRDEAGQPLASGMYFYRLEANAKEGTQKSFVDLKKMILMK